MPNSLSSQEPVGSNFKGASRTVDVSMTSGQFLDSLCTSLLVEFLEGKGVDYPQDLPVLQSCAAFTFIQDNLRNVLASTRNGISHLDVNEAIKARNLMILEAENISKYIKSRPDHQQAKRLLVSYYKYGSLGTIRSCEGKEDLRFSPIPLDQRLNFQL